MGVTIVAGVGVIRSLPASPLLPVCFSSHTYVAIASSIGAWASDIHVLARSGNRGSATMPKGIPIINMRPMVRHL